MLNHDLKSILRDLRQPSQQDLHLLENTDADDIVSAIRKMYPVTFQEGQTRTKQEWAVAKQMFSDLHRTSGSNSLFGPMYIRPVYFKCLYVVAENNRVTGLAKVGLVAVKPVRKPRPGLEITSSTGMKLDLMVDGWFSQRTKSRVVRLPESLLRSRGWNFNHLTQPFTHS